MPLDIPAVASLLGVKLETVYQWRVRGVMCTPDGFVSGAPWWRESTVKTWARETGRL